ncbi:MAG: YcnI family protein [Pseudolabrys sp.]|nr:YcnI family protein [Pseudolabrys sp.]MBV9955326.1 YcnI family protein [Pseudolabrys sp.]
MKAVLRFGRVALLLGASALPSNAHVTLEQREATLGAPTKLTFRVGHGCGESPTIKVRVQIPEGVIAAKPMPKPGWAIDTFKSRYAKTYEFFHGAKLSEGVTEIAWTGKLADAHYDEFVASVFVAADLKPGRLFFPVVQECEQGVHRWIEIPAGGQAGHDLKEPAPSLILTPKR